MRITHVESETTLEVRLGQHLGLVTRGAKSYESVYVNLLRTLIGPGDRIFDVGANIGFYSVLFSRWVGLGGSVLSYEPDTDNLKLLERNVDRNNCENIRIRALALGDEVGETLFSRDKITGSTGHLGSGPTYAETIFGKSREFIVPVEVTTLDREVSMWGPPSLMKVDVEGGEFNVLSGGPILFSTQRPVVVSELSSWDDNAELGTARAASAFRFLGEHDYLMWDVDSGRQINRANDVWMILGVPGERLSEPRVERALSRLALSSRQEASAAS